MAVWSLTHSHRTEAGGRGKRKQSVEALINGFLLRPPSGNPTLRRVEKERGHRNEVIIPANANTFPNLGTLPSGLPRLPHLGEQGQGALRRTRPERKKAQCKSYRRPGCPTHGYHRETRLKCNRWATSKGNSNPRAGTFLRPHAASRTTENPQGCVPFPRWALRGSGGPLACMQNSSVKSCFPSTSWHRWPPLQLPQAS